MSCFRRWRSAVVLVPLGAALLWLGRAPKLSPAAHDLLKERARACALAVSLSLPLADAEEADLEGLARLGERVLAEGRSALKSVAASEGADPEDVRRAFASKLAGLLRLPPLRLTRAAAPPLRMLAAGGPAAEPPPAARDELLAVIGRLEARLAKLPPNSPQARALRQAIETFRGLLGAADLTPIEIRFTAPSPNAVLAEAPAVTFEMTDADSGPDPESRSLELLTPSGPTPIPTTLASSGATRVVVQAEGASLPDGFLTLSASGTDRAGNPPSSTFLNFVLDRSAPALSLSFPLDLHSGSPVPLAFSVEDAVSGLRVETLSITLPGGVVEPFSVNASAPNGLGLPARADVLGSLTAPAGTYTMLVSISDAAGNVARVERTFTVISPPPPPPPPPPAGLALNIVSGDGQTGLAGRGAEQALRVRATRLDTGLPAQGVALCFAGNSASGIFARDPGYSTITNADGVASVRYLFARKPGPNPVRAYAAGFEDVAPVVFSLTGQAAELEETTERGPFNCHFGTSEYPGSALGRIFRFKATRPDGSPLSDELIRPYVADFNGAPPVQEIGRFMPTRAWTDPNGEARFVFVLNQDAPPGSFTMRFALPDFRDGDDEEIKRDVGGEVLDPAFKPGDATINWDDPATSGQGQIGVPERPLRPWRTKGRNRIYYTLLEGSGAMTQGPEGQLVEAGADPFCNGAPYWGVNTEGAEDPQRASIVFTPSSDFALVHITGATDIFAVAPPEAHFVGQNAGGLRMPVPNAFPADPAAATESERLYVAVRMPKGMSPAGELRSLNAFGEFLPALDDGIAPTSLPALSFSPAPGPSEPGYDEWHSAPAQPTATLLLPGQTPSPGGAVALLQTTPMGWVEAAVQAGPKRTVIRVRNQFQTDDGDTRSLVYNRRDDPTNPGSARIKFRFKAHLATRHELARIEWAFHGAGGPTKTVEKKDELWAEFGDVDDFAPDGKTMETSIVVALPETKAHKRKVFDITAKIVVRNAKGEELQAVRRLPFRIALDSKTVGDPAPAQSQANLDAFADPAGKMGWTSSPPTLSDGTPVVFADPATAPPHVSFPANLPAYLNANPLASWASKEQAETFRDPVSFAVYGTAIYSHAFDYDKEVLAATIDHEMKHVLATADPGSRFRQLSAALKAVGIPAKDLERYLVRLDHSRFILGDLTDPRVSWRAHNDRNAMAARGLGGNEAHFVNAFNAIEQTVLEKTPYEIWFGDRFGGTVPAVNIDPGDPTLREKLKADLDVIYARALEVFPELADREEFHWQLHLKRPRLAP